MIYVFGSKTKRKQKIYNPQMTIGKPYCRTGRNEVKNKNYGTQVSLETNNITGDRYPISIIK